MKYVVLALALAATGCQAESQPPNAGSVLPSAAAPAHQRPLLYVATIDGAVSAYSYPHGKLVGQLTVNYGAAGICSDAQGNVYVTVPNGYLVRVYPHGGLFPIYTLSEEDDGVLPYGCASDPKTGDLAVVNVEGSVLTYKGGRGAPTVHNLGLSECFFATYDDKSDLFVSGERSGAFGLVEVPEGSEGSREISINATIAPEYAVAWSGKYLVLQSADSSGNATFLTVKVSGTNGKVVKTTTLSAPVNTSPTEFALDGGTIVEPDSGNIDVGFWAFPAGGAPTKTLQNVGTGLYGVTVSR